MPQKFIKNINSIKNCGVFYEWPKGQVAFGRYNLIYGWNGCGKTTLSRILRSLEKETIDPALSKNNAQPNFEFTQLDDSIIKSENLYGWKNNVRVFNRDFIEENIHMDNAEAEPVYHLGEGQGDALEKLEEVKGELDLKINKQKDSKKELTRQEKKRSSNIKDKAQIIREAIVMNNYNAGNLRPQLEKFREQKIEVDKLKLNTENLCVSLNTARGNNDKDRLDDDLNIAPESNLEELYLSIEGVCQESVTKAVIDELDSNDGLREWALRGNDLHKDRKICAFCSSDITDKRRQLLGQYFNSAYEQLIKDIGEEKNKIQSFVDSIKKIDLPDRSSLYSECRNKYQNAKILFEKTRADLVTVFRKLDHSLDVKRNSKLTEGLIITPFSEIEQVKTAFFQNLNDLNGVISSHNEQYDNFEKTVQEAKNKIIDHYSAEHYPSYLELSETVEKLDSDLIPLNGTIEDLEQQKNELDAQLSEHHIAVERINELLASFIGRNDIKLVTNDKGYFIEREGVKAENLSEGERTAIAFTYFIAKMEEKDFEIDDSIIVVDDPISSLDTNALYAAASFIRCHLEKASQVFILTHNYQFFREIFGWMNKLQKQKTWHENVPYKSNLMLKCETKSDGKRAARPYPMDNTLKNYESEYLFLFKQLYDAYQTIEFTGKDNPDEIAMLILLPNIARRVLEIFVLFKFPDMAIGSVINLYNVIKPLGTKIPIEKISILDRILNRVSHGKEEGMDSINMLDVSETPKAIQYVLEFIKDADQLHFEGLERAIGSKKKTVPPQPSTLNDNKKNKEKAA